MKISFKILYVLTILLILSNCISAFDSPFAEYKEYSKTATTDLSDYVKSNLNTDYGVITIKDTFLWIPSGKIAEYSLTKNTDYCLINCEAEGKVTLYSDYVLFNDVKFKKLTGQQINLKSQYYIFEGYEDVINEIPTYKKVCETSKNLTSVCYDEISGYEKETIQKEIWKQYNGETLSAGNYRWKIKGEKNPYLSVDFIPVVENIEFSEWAVWNSTFTNGLVAYWGFDSNSSGVFIDNVTGKYNLTCLGDCPLSTTTKVLGSSSYDSQGDDGALIKGLTAGSLGGVGGNTVTINCWVYEDADQTYATFASFNASGEAFSIFEWLERNGAETWRPEFKTGGQKATGTAVSSGQWYMLTTSVNAGSGQSYLNGNADGSSFSSVSWGATTDSFMIGGNGINYGGNKIDAKIDECAVWNRSLSAVEITGLWNNGDGLTFVSEGIGAPTSINITLNSYPNNIYFTSKPQTIFFNSTALIVNGNFTNATLYVWNSTFYSWTNFSAIVGYPNATGKNLSLIISDDGSYKWNYKYCALNSTSDTVCEFATANRTFGIDTIPPTINITYPTENLQLLIFNATANITINFTVSDGGVGLSSCWFFNGTGNTTITCGTNTSQIFSGGNHTIIFYANDTLNQINSITRNFFINSVSYVVNYSSSVVEGENTTIYFNITASELTQANATINYNGTNYQMILSGSNGTSARFYRIITAPSVNADGIILFNISYYLNGNIYNTTNYSQIIYNIPNMTVGSCSPAAFTFNLVDEETLNSIVGDFEYNFYYGLSNSSFSRTYGKITNSSGFSLCVNTTISPSWTLGSGEIFYRNTTDYVDRRYYLFSGTTLTNVTTNVTLHDLLTSKQTSFKLEIESSSLDPYENIFASLIRWYPNLNEYRIVDMGRTDETGSTVIHVKTEDVDYRIGVYEQNGSLIKLAEPIRMTCLVSPCTYTLKISPTEKDFTSFLNIQNLLEYNETTGIWTFTFNDPSQKTSTMNLTVYKLTGTSIYPVCSSSVSSWSGAITCNTSIYTGTLKGEVKRSASPEVPIAQKVINVGTNAFKSKYGLFISFLIALPIMFLLIIVSPFVAILGGIISLIPAFYFGSINIGVFGGIIVLGGIVAHFIKRIG